jgi:hypothetical protein
MGLGCCSSVVEHSLGKGEVESSILSNSTMASPLRGRRLRRAISAQIHREAYPA